MKHLKTKTKFLTQLLAVVIISLSVFVGCKSNDKDVDGVKADMVTLKADLTKKVDDAKVELNNAINAAVQQLDGKIAKNTNAITEKVSKDAFETYKGDMVKEINSLKDLIGKAATKDELTAAEKRLNDKISELISTVKALGGRVDKLETTVSEQGTLLGEVNARVILLETILKNNGTAQSEVINGILTGLNNLKGRVEKAEGNITDLQKELKKLNTQMKKATAALDYNFEILSDRLVGLTFIPEFYVNSIPAFHLTSLHTDCATITPMVTVAYRLSPSFVTAKDIDTENIAFTAVKSTNVQRAPQKGAELANALKAKFNKIENGVLYVDVTITDYAAIKANTDLSFLTKGKEIFPAVALQVPLSKQVIKDSDVNVSEGGEVTINGKTYPADAVITSSQYVRVDVTEYTRNNVDLAIERVQYTDHILPYTLNAAKALAVAGVDGATTNAKTVLTLDYGKTLNLNDTVVALLNRELIGEEYNVKFRFDLKEKAGSNKDIVYERGANKTDQQKFIKLENGVVSAKVFEASEIAASQGRTPLVHVVAYNPEFPNCALKEAYIKILLADKPNPKPIVIEGNLGVKEFACNGMDEVVYGVEDMNVNIYNKTDLSKKDFHTTIYKNFAVDPTSEGTFGVRPDLQQTDTYVTTWSLTAAQIMDKLKNHKEYTFKASGRYVSAAPSKYPDIVFSYQVTYKRKAVKDIVIPEPELIKKLWYEDYSYIKHNVFVPAVGETDPTKAVFETNLSQVFEQTADHKISKLKDLAYRYEFIVKDGKNVIKLKYGEMLTVKNNNQEVWYKGEKIAEILPYNAAKGHILKLNKNSQQAKMLLNKGSEYLKVRIGIVVDEMLCNTFDVGDQFVKINGKTSFDVHFIRPLEPVGTVDGHYLDGVNKGDKGSYVGVGALVNLYDWRHSDGYDSSFEKHQWYYQYYGVSSISVDKANIKTDINSTEPVSVTKYPNMEVDVTAPDATYPYGKVTYFNNGTTFGKEFNLYIPVTITYTWGAIANEYVKVPVKSTTVNQ